MARVRDVRVRRVYEQASPDDGQRYLVDRLWPRGLAESAAHLDEWVRAVAPSDDLRRWYGHDPARFAEFRRRYVEELGEPERARALTHLNEAAREGTLTLLTGTKDAAHSEAEVLAELLRAGATTEGSQEEADRPGDPACWLKRVCPSCGSIADADPPTTCPSCRAAIPAQ
jgi:uncharacterized protein YeaO (DUF488 family)